MVSLIALAICALASTAAGADTCDSSDQSKCMSAAGTEHAVKGDALLQAVQVKARTKDVHEQADVHESDVPVSHEAHDDQPVFGEPRTYSEIEEQFNECEHHAEALCDRLHDALESTEEPALHPDVAKKVQHTVAMLQDAQQELKTLRGNHMALLESSKKLPIDKLGVVHHAIQRMLDVEHEAEEVLHEVDEYYGRESSLVQEDEDNEDHEEEDEHEDDEDHDEEEDEEGDGEDDDDDDEDDDDDDDEHHDDHDEEHVSAMQKGTGVYHEPEATEKNIKRH